MLNAKRELAYLREAVPLLNGYLQSRDTAWQLPMIAGDAGQPFSLLTLGVLLFMLKRLKTRVLTSKYLEELGEYEGQIFQNKIHNEVIWKKKVDSDLASRARLWQGWLDDYHKDPKTVGVSYSSHVSQRVILQLLLDELDSPGILTASLEFILQSLDASLRLIFKTGEFIWEEELRPGFDREIFWYLYGRIK